MDQTIETKTNPAVSSPPPPTSNTSPAVPIGVKIIAVLFYLASIIFIFAGIILAFVSSFTLQILGSFGLTTGLIPGATAIIWGLLNFFAGRGLWSGRQWGRTLAITINFLYIIVGIIGLIMSGHTNYISLVINLIIILYLLFSKSVSAAFQTKESVGKTITPAILAMIVYAIMVYPSFVPQQTALSQVSQLYQQSNQQAAPTPDPLYGPVVQSLTPAGTYSNTVDGFKMDLPFDYSVQEKQTSGGDGVLISGTQAPMILVATAPTTLSLKDSIQQHMGDLVSNDTFTNTTVAGEPAMQDTGNPAVHNPGSSVNIYFLIHNGVYYMFQKTGSFKTGQIITDDQFNSAIQSLKFTK